MENIFGMLAANDQIQIDDRDRHLGPAEHLAGHESAFTRDQSAVRRNDRRMQQANVGNVLRKRFDVAHVLAVALANLDVADLEFFERRMSAITTSASNQVILGASPWSPYSSHRQLGDQTAQGEHLQGSGCALHGMVPPIPGHAPKT